MLGGQPGIHDASESDRNVMVTSYEKSRRLTGLDESKRVQMAIKERLKQERTAEAMYQQDDDIAGIAKALSRDERAAIECHHANGISGGETKSEEAAEPTGEYVADRSDDSGSERGGNEDRMVGAEPSPRSVPFVAKSGGGNDVGKQSTETAEAGNDSEAEEETQASQTTRELDALSVKRCKQVEARREETEDAIKGDTASEPTDTVGKMASLKRGGGAPADLEGETVQEGATSGGRDGESSGAETGGSDHGSSCEQRLEGDSKTTREHELELKAADVSEKIIKDEADSAPSGVGVEGAVNGHEKDKGEEASREEAGESESGSVDAGSEVVESTSDEETIGAGIAEPAASLRGSSQ